MLASRYGMDRQEIGQINYNIVYQTVSKTMYNFQYNVHCTVTADTKIKHQITCNEIILFWKS